MTIVINHVYDDENPDQPVQMDLEHPVFERMYNDLVDAGYTIRLYSEGYRTYVECYLGCEPISGETEITRDLPLLKAVKSVIKDAWKHYMESAP
jgi:hypothetical protein